MRFKNWLENKITRKDAKDFVLDAVGASEHDLQTQNDVISSLIKHHPDLEHKLKSYSELRPYQSQINGYIRTSKHKTLQQLIDFIDKLDEPEEPEDDQDTDIQKTIDIVKNQIFP